MSKKNGIVSATIERVDIPVETKKLKISKSGRNWTQCKYDKTVQCDKDLNCVECDVQLIFSLSANSIDIDRYMCNLVNN